MHMITHVNVNVAMTITMDRTISIIIGITILKHTSFTISTTMNINLNALMD